VTATIAPVTIRSLRQSTINDAMTCLHRLTWVDDPDYPYQASASTAMGTGYHAGLEAAYRRRMEGEMWATVLPDIDLFVVEAIGALAMEIEKAGDNFNWELQARTARKEQRIIDFEEASDIVEHMVRTYFDGGHYWDDTYQIVAVEHRFELPWGPTWTRTGTIDLVALKGNTLTVIDNKTAKAKWRKGKADAYSSPQQGWYQQAASEIWPGYEVTGAYDVMTLDGDFQRHLAHRTEAQRRLALKAGAAVAKQIERGGPYPPTPDSFLCHQSYCDYWSVCEFGRGLHEGDPKNVFA